MSCLKTSLPGDLVASLEYNYTSLTGEFGGEIGYVDAYDIDVTFTRIDPPRSWLQCLPDVGTEEYLAPFVPGEFTFLEGRNYCCPNKFDFVQNPFPFDTGFPVAPYFWDAGTRTNTWNGMGPMPAFLKPLAIYHLVGSAFISGIVIGHCRENHLTYFVRAAGPDEPVTPTIDLIQPDPEDPNTVGEISIQYGTDPDVTGFIGAHAFSWTDPTGRTGTINITGGTLPPFGRNWFTFPQTTCEIFSDDPDAPIDTNGIFILLQENGWRLKLTGNKYKGLTVSAPVLVDGELDAAEWEKAANSILVTVSLFLNYITYYERDPLAPPDVPPDGEPNEDFPGDFWGSSTISVDLPDNQGAFALSENIIAPDDSVGGTIQFNTV